MPPVPTDRTPPQVPNHEMIRIIGCGAYGEIWLGRSVTGTWRAVKIVDRRTFDSDRSFQREFEGMARFEPISRGDPGFVDILHVGRDPEGDFFFYVMELADDHLAGGPIDPERYVPKTLKSELSRRSRLFVNECLTLGLSLSRAVAALHAQGLVHRDIKPANIIFVGGVPKIADIGLVAASGQGTFVGTEGYVPPEGPGTPGADVYSLGKVLYEISMGKDRLDFPALHTRLDELPDKASLLELNHVLLRACAADPAERYATAEELHDDLARLRDGEPLASRGSRRGWAAALVALLVLACVGGYFGWRHTGRGTVTITADPPGGFVVIGDRIKALPARFERLTAGEHTARVMRPGFEPVEVAFELSPKEELELPAVRLERSHGAIELSSSPVGATFELRQGDAVIEQGVTPAVIASIATGEFELVMKLDGRELKERVEIKRGETISRTIEFATGKIAVTSDPAGAQISVDGQPAGPAPIELALAEGEHEVSARHEPWPEQRRRVTAQRAQPATAAFDFPRGSVKISSKPGGAQVFAGGVEIGRTPLLLEELEPGEVRYELRLTGFKPLEVSGSVKPGEQTFLPVSFAQRAGPERGAPWVNSLGMKFVPVGDVLMGIWPVRVRDYEAFAQATGRGIQVPDFPQEPEHPVVKVSWNDAAAFCAWLTEKERADAQLEEGQEYRLPSDAEWSRAAGLPEESGATPEARDGKAREFPWGRQWPPPPGVGNYADTALRKAGATATIAGYHDGFARTSPVGSFPANALGLHDIGGNVWQWCLEGYNGMGRSKDWGVLRGGSWASAVQGELRASYRNAVDRGEREVIYGFRCVLVPEPAR